MSDVRWEALPATVLRELAAALGLARTDPAAQLTDRYPDGPDEEFVRLTWPVLRDRWVAHRPAARRRLVAALRRHGLGDLTLPDRTAAEQRAYLATCRNGHTLRTQVLAVLQQTLGVTALGAHPSTGPELALDDKVEAAWSDFGQRLARTIAAGHPGDVVVIDLAARGEGVGADYYVQWEVRDDGTVRAEAVGNAALDPDDQLPPQPLARLAALGWLVPSAEGQPNFQREGSTREPADLAHTVVRTLREVYNAPHPAFLTSTGFNGEEQLDLSPLGLTTRTETSPAQRGTGAEAEGRLVDQVVAVLAEGLGVPPEKLQADRDGDYPIRAGSAMVFIRATEDAGLVTVFSPVLVDVGDDDTVRARLLELQRRLPLIRLALAGGAVTATIQVMAAPLVPEHLERAIVIMTRVCDELDEQLQGEFGGRTFFGPPAQARPADEPVGGYL
ncbi:MAG: YbjN domain-containing protein [Actinomycetia bacterium]|nr:YbjN domain-containing protein [Actinomycetes bacterium]